MNWLKTFRIGLRSLWQRHGVKREIDEELRFHLEQRTAENIAAGMAPEKAAGKAHKRFGNPRGILVTRGASLGGATLQDIRFGLRTLGKNPGYTAAAVLTLALGLSVNSLVFTSVNDFFLRPLPAKDPEQLVVIAQKSQHFPMPFPFSYPDYLDFRASVEGAGPDRCDLNKTFSGLMAYCEQTVHMSRSGQGTERTWLHAVSENYFDVLGVTPLRGRLFLPEEGRKPGADPIIVLTYDAWRSRFGADPSVVGQPVKLNGLPFTIVGVTPPGFVGAAWGTALSGFVPATMLEEMNPALRGMIENRGHTGFFIMGRLQPGASLGQARSAASVMMARLNTDYPKDHIATQALVMRESRSRPSPFVANYTPLIVSALTALALLVLAVAVANVANLLYARAADRERELAVRSALGASRGRLLRQLLVESVLLALGAGLLGALAALWVGPNLSSIKPTGIAPPTNTGADWRWFAFTFGIALAAGVLTGLFPALKASRLEIATQVMDGARTMTQVRHPLRSLLVVGQIAVSCVVLICAGLAIRSLHQLSRVNLGFQPGNLLLASFDLEMQRYGQEQAESFQRLLLERVAALPGVRDAGLAEHVPFDVGGGMQGGIHAEGKPVLNESQLPAVPCIAVDHNYLKTAGIPVPDGRDFSVRDDASAPRVAIVNRVLARLLWPDEPAVGKRLVIGRNVFEVIGVVGEGCYWAITDRARPLVFFPLAQNYRGRLTLVVRTEANPAPLNAAVQQVVRGLDPDLPLHDLRTMKQQMARSPLALMPVRMGATLAGAQGMIVLLLAILGIFGLVSFSVTRRTREIGIRMAVGATTMDIIRLAAFQGVKLTLLGLSCGLLLALGLTRLLAGLLYGVSPADPVVFGSVTVIIILSAALGAWIPVRRAARVDPMAALRSE